MDIKFLYSIIKNTDDDTIPLHDNENWNELMECYIKEKIEDYRTVDVKQGIAKLISEQNLRIRKNACSCKEFNVDIRVGDICYIDFGEAYNCECGYQHFALILSIFENKAFVIPMTSSYDAYKKAYSPSNPKGKKNLMRFKKVGNMSKDSVLFINDAKYISTARIIDVKGHINKNGTLFKEIKNRVIQLL